MSDTQRGDEQDFLSEQGDSGAERIGGGEGAGGTSADESFTMGGARGRDAEAGEYEEPNPVDDENE